MSSALCWSLFEMISVMYRLAENVPSLNKSTHVKFLIPSCGPLHCHGLFFTMYSVLLFLCQLSGHFASVEVIIGPGRLNVLLSFVPVWDPAPSSNSSCSIGVCPLVRGSIASSTAHSIQFLCFIGELIFIQDSTFFIAQLFRLSPSLFLSWRKDACKTDTRNLYFYKSEPTDDVDEDNDDEYIQTIEYNTSIMNEGGDQEHTLPLFPCLQRGRNKRVEYKNKILFEKSHRMLRTRMFLTLCLVIAPTMSGQTIPDRVPTPLEIPISMLA